MDWPFLKYCSQESRHSGGTLLVLLDYPHGDDCLKPGLACHSHLGIKLQCVSSPDRQPSMLVELLVSLSGRLPRLALSHMHCSVRLYVNCAASTLIIVFMCACACVRVRVRERARARARGVAMFPLCSRISPYRHELTYSRSALPRIHQDTDNWSHAPSVHMFRRSDSCWAGSRKQLQRQVTICYLRRSNST